MNSLKFLSKTCIESLEPEIPVLIVVPRLSALPTRLSFLISLFMDSIGFATTL